MELNEWLQTHFKSIELSDEPIESTVTAANGAVVNTIRKPDQLCVDLTYALLATDTPDEFKKAVFTYLPVGTIIEDIDRDWYDSKLLQLRQTLTRMLMNEKSRHLADRYLKILERRDRDHWRDSSKSMNISAKTQDTNIQITFSDV
nr:MAG TPA: hypothetical protein [Caudoviricetes sp.]